MWLPGVSHELSNISTKKNPHKIKVIYNTLDHSLANSLSNSATFVTFTYRHVQHPHSAKSNLPFLAKTLISAATMSPTHSLSPLTFSIFNFVPKEEMLLRSQEWKRERKKEKNSVQFNMTQILKTRVILQRTTWWCFMASERFLRLNPSASQTLMKRYRANMSLPVFVRMPLLQSSTSLSL